MKTAISLPDELFDAISARAKTLKISRSALLAQAARSFLESGEPSIDPTEAWNVAIKLAGQPGDDPAALAARRGMKARMRATPVTKDKRKRQA
jgi:predicted transcriptional regulator